MEESIKKFNQQFDFEPEIQNAEHLKDFDHVIFCGMGGSHLAADVIKTIKPGIDIYVHKDYDLPPYEEDFLARGLLIACSYSGNTEETISFFQSAYEKDYQVAIITTGGELLKLAQTKDVPYIEIPNIGIQPRQAIGFISLAILKLLGDDDTIYSWGLLKERLNPVEIRTESEKILNSLEDKVPIIYSSNRNLFLANIWKIKFNETAKIPSYFNVFPELNHNEMQGMQNSKNFHVIFLEDEDDNEKIKQRMRITRELYSENGITTDSVSLQGKTREEKVFNSILLSDWVSFGFAKKKGFEAERVPLIEEFKKRLI